MAQNDFGFKKWVLGLRGVSPKAGLFRLSDGRLSFALASDPAVKITDERQFRDSLSGQGINPDAVLCDLNHSGQLAM